MTAERTQAEAPPRERGSVLLLMPVAVLVMVILGSLAVDRAIVFGAQRDLVAVAQAAANDGAGVGVDPNDLHGAGRLGYDPVRIDRAVRAAVSGADGEVRVRWGIRDGAVIVELKRSVDLVFARGVPGATRSAHIAARASAVLALDSVP